MLKLLIIGFIAFIIALIDGIITNAQSFSDLHGWGKFFAAIVIGIVASWFIILGLSQIKKK